MHAASKSLTAATADSWRKPYLLKCIDRVNRYVRNSVRRRDRTYKIRASHQKHLNRRYPCYSNRLPSIMLTASNPVFDFRLHTRNAVASTRAPSTLLTAKNLGGICFTKKYELLAHIFFTKKYELMHFRSCVSCGNSTHVATHVAINAAFYHYQNFHDEICANAELS